jgi:hypothetical protein
MTMADTKSALSGVVSQLPVDRLKKEAQGFGEALTQQGLSRASKGVESVTGKLNDYAQGKSTATKAAANVAQGDSPVKGGIKAVASKAKDTVKDKLGMGGGGGNGGKLKVTNILESVDVPVSRDVAYEQWTLFEDFPTFMKKVENVKQEEDEKLTFKAQVFWSHRSWDAEIVEQVPNERIVWKSDGEKGSVDGAVTFHELAPDLTRVLMTLEYHPKGFFEHTGNLWRAQGRRARLELKHFARHVSTQTLLHQEEVDGWEGEIRDGEVVERKQGDSEEDSSQEGGSEQDEKPDQDKSEQEKGRSEEEGKSEQGRSGRSGRRQSRRRSSAEKPSGEKDESKAPAKKTAAARKSPAKRSTSGSTAKKAPAKKSAGSSSSTRKTTAKKAAAKKAPAKKAPAKKTAAAKKSPAKRSTSGSTAKKAPAKKSGSSSSSTRKSTAKNTSANKRTAKATSR